jgi:hypothetical protein
MLPVLKVRPRLSRYLIVATCCPFSLDVHGFEGNDCCRRAVTICLCRARGRFGLRGDGNAHCASCCRDALPFRSFSVHMRVPNLPPVQPHQLAEVADWSRRRPCVLSVVAGERCSWLLVEMRGEFLGEEMRECSPPSERASRSTESDH